MKHTSIELDSPIELINITPYNPLISKCQIKVCYVSDEPNRNKSIITKDLAKELANSLPGSPIVGLYNEETQDFEQHSRTLTIKDGKIGFEDITKPYGFVDLNAKVWFQKFLDDNENEREYMVTEGWIWTGQYPEAKRIIEKGNNQSMEFSDDEKYFDGFWTKDNKGKPQFFIINEAIIAKLCILGEDYEPCFEGASITSPKVQFSFDDDFKTKLFSMMNELKDLLQNKGGEKVFNTFAVEIGCGLWDALYSFIDKTFGSADRTDSCKYGIRSIWEDGQQKFAILADRDGEKLYRMNFSFDENDAIVSDGVLTEVEEKYVPTENSTYSLDEIKEYEAKRYSLEGKTDESADDNTDNNPEDNEQSVTENGKESTQDAGEDESTSSEEAPATVTYTLEEIPEYVELNTKYSALLQECDALRVANESLEAKIAPLTQFKHDIEKKDKEAMIASFYMLSDDDKKDVIDHIEEYSLDDIEAKLSVICVRNKVNFNLDEENKKSDGPVSYNLNSGSDEGDSVPAWVKAAMEVSKNMN